MIAVLYVYHTIVKLKAFASSILYSYNMHHQRLFLLYRAIIKGTHVKFVCANKLDCFGKRSSRITCQHTKSTSNSDSSSFTDGSSISVQPQLIILSCVKTNQHTLSRTAGQCSYYYTAYIPLTIFLITLCTCCASNLKTESKTITL